VLALDVVGHLAPYAAAKGGPWRSNSRAPQRRFGATSDLDGAALHDRQRDRSRRRLFAGLTWLLQRQLNPDGTVHRTDTRLIERTDVLAEAQL
jgi:hypothetical protein